MRGHRTLLFLHQVDACRGANADPRTRLTAGWTRANRSTTKTPHPLPHPLERWRIDAGVPWAHAEDAEPTMDEPRETAASAPGPSFGGRLRRARDAANLTQEALAARAGLTPNAVSA